MKKILFLFILLGFIFSERIIVNGCTVRTQPNKNSESIGAITKGSFDVLDKFGDYGKYKVISSSKIGWISTLYVTPSLVTSNQFTVTGAGVNMYSTPFKSTNLITTVASKEALELIELKVTWYEINFEGKNGWVSAGYAEPEVIKATTVEPKKAEVKATAKPETTAKPKPEVKK